MTSRNTAGRNSATSKPSRVSANLDFDAPGKHHGELRVPHSRDDSAWGFIQIPITVINGERGAEGAPSGRRQTILMTGAAHGDEYEGPISLMKLARSVDPTMIDGRLIIVPTLNIPAARAGTRLSPIDRLNLNRAYPGRRTGSVSEMIADYVYRELVAIADIVVDFHSGGKTLDFVPCAVMHEIEDEALFSKTLAAVKAFGAPVGLVLRELDDEGMLDTAVEEQGKVFISTELGGGGYVTARSVAITDYGVTHLLRHFDMLDPESNPLAVSPTLATETRLMHTPDSGCFVASSHDGIFEILVDIGSEISAGDPIGRVHFFEDACAPAVTYCASKSGILLSRHFPGLIKKGDCMAVIAQDSDRLP
jgi:N2-acetyl-L-2,4-diaminobutanoate deacetylase